METREEAEETRMRGKRREIKGAREREREKEKKDWSRSEAGSFWASN